MTTLRRAIVRPPSANFADGLTTVALGAPDVARALRQHEAYVDALRACGLEVERLPADPRYPDGTFVEDTAVVTPRGVILTRPGAPSRAGEVEAIRAAIERDFPRPDRIEAPGTLDGGDVCEAGERFLVGLSERTNEEGARQLAVRLAAAGIETDLVDVRGVPGILHLKSGLSYLGRGRVAAIPALAAHPALRRYEVVPIAPEEAYAANAVVVNDRILVADGYPDFARRLKEIGERPLAVPMSEFRKMDGGLSCLSLRF